MRGRCALAVLLSVAGAAAAADVAPALRTQALTRGDVDALLVLSDQSVPTLAPLAPSADYRVRRRVLVDALRGRSDAAQRALRTWLDARGIAHRDFWIANVIQARVPAALLDELAARPEIARLAPNPAIANALPPVEAPAPRVQQQATTSIGWGVSKIHAPDVWALGFTGQGAVIGGEDTGYQWDHPALKPQYRGWNGATADHNHNWHDAIHDATGTLVCANDSPAPCDDDSHGTHTAGTFAGDDHAGTEPGVAPGARWIGCRNMDRGTGTPARYIECMQWMLAPTDLAGNNANPDLAPDVISNSWSCPEAAPPTGEGCTPADVLETAVANLVAGGILYVAAAQNSGPNCATIFDPPAIYPEAFVIGATDASDALANFSSRGPVGSSGPIRPDVSAPGTGIVSSVPTNSYATMSGTSMATPHVAGVAALLLSAHPKLKGRPHALEAILRASATHAVTDPALQACGGTAITDWPNNMVGYGRVDALAACREIIFMDGFDG